MESLRRTRRWAMNLALVAVAVAALVAVAVAALVAGAGAAAPADTASPAKPAAEAAPKPASPAGPERWESRVQAHEKAAEASPPPPDAILFVGSSTVRMWKSLQDDFKPLPVVGRGVGGCNIPDMVHYAERLVLPVRPSQVVFYAGDNDLAGKRTAEQVLADFQAFVAKVRPALPRTVIHFIAIKPSPSRAALWDEAKKANALVREYAAAAPGLGYIDTATPMLGPDGKPRPELFLKDMLHLNREGYDLWVPIVRAALEKGAAGAAK